MSVSHICWIVAVHLADPELLLAPNLSSELAGTEIKANHISENLNRSAERGFSLFLGS